MRQLLEKYRSLSLQMKASIWYLFCGFLQKGISLLTTPIFTRIMTQSEYGQFNVYLSWFGILQICISLNLSYSVYLQGLVKYEDDKDKFTSSLVGLTTLLTGIALVVYIATSSFVNPLIKLSTPIILCMILSTWTEAIFSFWSGRLRNDFKYQSLVLLSVLVALAKPILGVIFIFVFPGYGLEARVFSMTIIEIVAYMGLFIRQLKDGRVFYHKFYWKYAILYNLPLVPHYLSQAVLSSSDRIMIASMSGDAAAAIYGLAYSLGMIMTIVNTALSNTFTPWVYQRIKHNEYSNIGKYSNILMILVAGANLLLVSFAPEIIRIFAPESYYGAIWLIPPIAIGTYFMFMYNVFANFAFYFEKTKAITLGSCTGAVLNLILNYIFIQLFGYRAAAYTTFFCYMLYAIGHYIFMRVVFRQCINEKNLKTFNSKIIVAISLTFIFIVILIMQLYNTHIIRYSVFIIMISVGYIKRKTIKELLTKMKGQSNG